jgi:hypothetical protein
MSLVAATLAAAPARAAVHGVRIDGDRITLTARNTPLQDLMADFVHAGVSVRIDPDLNPRVTGRVVDAPVEATLEELLAPYGYTLTWSILRGPLGDLPRLQEIQVFRRDGPRRLEPFQPEPNFRIARGPLPGDPEFVADEILIAFKPGTNIDQFRLLLAQIGGTVIESSPSLGLYRVRLPPNSNVLAIVELLKAQGIVSRVEPNYAYRLPAPGAAADNTPATTTTAPTAPRTGVPPVAVLDSGVLPLAPLSGLIAGAYDAIQPERSVADEKGHGTQMALIASGAIPPGGVASDAEGVPVLAIRTFDDNGYTSNFTLMRAIDYAAAEGAKVVNMSWGSPTSSSFLDSAMREAQRQGMVVVASAGNEPTGRPVYPAAYPGVISVSALQADGSPWPQSNHGSTVTIAAPGTAQFPVGHEGPPGGYAGTSIASAYVARNLALYLGENPTATAQQAAQALQRAASPPPTAAVTYGRGTLDAAATTRLLGR